MLVTYKNDLNAVPCVPAIIRKCKGFVIEVVTVEPKRTRIFNTIKLLLANGYNVYTLLHSENDMSKPTYITDSYKSGIVNRFGWFITKDEMIFPKNFNYSMRINSSNVRYLHPYFIDNEDTFEFEEIGTVDSDDKFTVFNYLYFTLPLSNTDDTREKISAEVDDDYNTDISVWDKEIMMIPHMIIPNEFLNNFLYKN